MFFKKKIKDETREEQLKGLKELPEFISGPMISGEDCDQVSGATGEFGKNKNNPIPVNSSTGEIVYLNRLRRKGVGFMFHRLGSTKNINNADIDVYELVAIDGSYWDVLYFDMYHPRRSTLAPTDYFLDDFDSIYSKLSIFGASKFDEKFPFGLPNIVRKKYGSLGDKFSKVLEESLVDSSYFVRPKNHEVLVKSIMDEEIALGESKDKDLFKHNSIKEEVKNNSRSFDVQYFNAIIFLRNNIEKIMFDKFEKIEHTIESSLMQKEVKILSYFILKLILDSNDFDNLITIGIVNKNKGIDISDIDEILYDRLDKYQAAYQYYLEETEHGVNFSQIIYGYCVRGKELPLKELDKTVDVTQAFLCFNIFLTLGLKTAEVTVDKLRTIREKN